MGIIVGGKKFLEEPFTAESDLEELVVHQSKLLFGEKSIFFTKKRKVAGAALGNYVPDGYLFDLSDSENPEFYLVEVELAKHDFYRHIFPQITKFFSFFGNPASQQQLIEKLFGVINEDSELKSSFRQLIGEKEIYKFLKDTFDESQNILLLIDGDKKEFPEIIETYSDTWGQFVKILKVKQYTCGSETLISVEPEFRDLLFTPEPTTITPDENEEDENEIAYSEEYHLEKGSEVVKEIYLAIKNYFREKYPDVKFNPQKYYISLRKPRNIAYLTFRKKKIRLVVMLPPQVVGEYLKTMAVHELSEGVQRYFNGPCCGVYLDNTENLHELWPLVDRLIEERGE